MKRALLVSMVFALLALPGLSSAQVLGHGTEAFVKYLMTQDRRPRGIRAGSCFETNSLLPGAEVWVFVLVPRSAARSYVVEVIYDPTDKPSRVTSNVGYLNRRAGRVEIEDNMGGLYTNERLRQFSVWILARGLKTQRTYARLFDHRPAVHCPQVHSR